MAAQTQQAEVTAQLPRGLLEAHARNQASAGLEQTIEIDSDEANDGLLFRARPRVFFATLIHRQIQGKSG